MKDIPYLTHDLGARNDPKLIELQIEMGGQGLAIYWCLVEMLWENGGRIPAKYKTIAFSLPWSKPEEIERVVTEFGLFKVEDGVMWSEAALERIEAKREKFGKIKEARSHAANARWRKPGAGDNANAMHMHAADDANALHMHSESDAIAGENNATNLLTNLHTNKQNNNNNNAPTALDVFEIFLLERNFKDPAGEVTRFLKHYEERSWTYQDGTPITDWTQAARDWKPQKAGTRWDAEALNWYRAVWNTARGRVDNAEEVFLCGLTNIRRDGQKVALRYRTENTARAAASFIIDNSLAGDYEIDFRIDN